MDEAMKILAALDDPALTIGGLKELARQAAELAGRIAGEMEASRNTPPLAAVAPPPLNRGECALTFCAQMEGGEVVVGKDVLTENETGWLEIGQTHRSAPTGESVGAQFIAPAGERRIEAIMFVTPWGKFGPIQGYEAYNFMALSEASVNSGRNRLTGVQILGLRKDGKVDVHRIDLLPQITRGVETMKINQGDKIIEIPFKNAFANWRPGG